MPSTLPISSCIGRTDDSSTSITRLDFSSPMPRAICDPYTLIRIQTTMMVNRPVSRDDSDVDGASRPRTGSETPCATADAAPGTVWISVGEPGELRERCDGTGQAAERHLLDDDLLAVDEHRAQVAAAQRGLRGRLARLGDRDRLPAGQPPRLGDDAAQRGRVAADDADPRRLALAGQDGWQRHGERDRDEHDHGRDHEHARLGPQPDLPARHQPGHPQRRAVPRGTALAVSPAGPSRPCSCSSPRSRRYAACHARPPRARPPPGRPRPRWPGGTPRTATGPRRRSAPPGPAALARSRIGLGVGRIR